MEFFDALSSLRKANPDCNEDDLRSALESETSYEESQSTGRDKYGRAVETAYNRLTGWLRDGCEYGATLDWRNLAHFTASHRPAVVYGVMIAKARYDEKPA